MSGRLLLSFVIVCASGFAQTEADASRGPQILREKGCTGCHAVSGETSPVSSTALSRPLNREYSPAGFTATLWNHAPRMFEAIRKQKGTVPQVSEDEAEDLFAYFASLRYFEPMGEASRGARLIHTKKCAECHFSSGPGALVETWRTLRDPIDIAASLWNHQPKMQAEMAKRGIKPPSLTAQELTDILVYVRGLPDFRKSGPAMMQLPSLDGADKLVEQYGCTGCHKGEQSFERILDDQSMTDIAASMWNHGAKMTAAVREIPTEEMRKIVAWIWARQLAETHGSVTRGDKIARQRKCMDCHSGGGAAPSFASVDHPFTVVDMTSAIWKHGPGMMDAMAQKGVKWPRFTRTDIQDLLAFISAQKK